MFIGKSRNITAQNGLQCAVFDAASHDTIGMISNDDMSVCVTMDMILCPTIIENKFGL